MTTPAKLSAEELERIRFHSKCPTANSNLEPLLNTISALEAEIGELKRENAHLEANVSPIDYKRAYEMCEMEIEKIKNRSPELLQRLFKERDQLKAENEQLRAQVAELKLFKQTPLYISGTPNQTILEWIEPVIDMLKQYIPRRGTFVDQAIARLTAIREQLERNK